MSAQWRAAYTTRKAPIPLSIEDDHGLVIAGVGRWSDIERISANDQPLQDSMSREARRSVETFQSETRNGFEPSMRLELLILTRP